MITSCETVSSATRNRIGTGSAILGLVAVVLWLGSCTVVSGATPGFSYTKKPMGIGPPNASRSSTASYQRVSRIDISLDKVWARGKLVVVAENTLAQMELYARGQEKRIGGKWRPYGIETGINKIGFMSPPIPGMQKLRFLIPTPPKFMQIIRYLRLNLQGSLLPIIPLKDFRPFCVSRKGFWLDIAQSLSPSNANVRERRVTVFDHAETSGWPQLP